MIVSSRQIRAARALLDWSQSDLARQVGMNEASIRNFEKENNSPNRSTVAKIVNALQSYGVVFLEDDGVAFRKVGRTTYKGRQGFSDFMDDVYNTAKNEGGDIFLWNAKPANWVSWLGRDWVKMHLRRMTAIGATIDFRATAEKNNKALLGSHYGEYRWVEEKLFNENSIYVYGNKIGLFYFGDDTVSIDVIMQPGLVDNFKRLFRFVWEHGAIPAKLNKAIEREYYTNDTK